MLGADGTGFECEWYNVGHLYTLGHFVERGLVELPLFGQSMFVIPDGIGAEVENLMHVKRRPIASRSDHRGSVLGAGSDRSVCHSRPNGAGATNIVGRHASP